MPDLLTGRANSTCRRPACCIQPTHALAVTGSQVQITASADLLVLFGFARILTLTFFEKKSRMHDVLNEVYLQKFFRVDVIFRDESNDCN